MNGLIYIDKKSTSVIEVLQYILNWKIIFPSILSFKSDKISKSPKVVFSALFKLAGLEAFFLEVLALPSFLNSSLVPSSNNLV